MSTQRPGDQTLALALQGHKFLRRRTRPVRPDGIRGRVLGKPAVFVTGARRSSCPAWSLSRWAGIDPDPDDVRRRTNDLRAPRPPSGGFEVLNLIRPITAIDRHVTFCALGAARASVVSQMLVSDGDEAVELVVQEVRRLAQPTRQQQEGIDMAESHVSDELWQEFHTVVNMSSRELSDWLRTMAGGVAAEPGTGPPELELGEQVLAILGKRQTDVTDDDVEAMQAVVDQVRTLRGEEPESEALDDVVRHLLMSLGHDPLKPTEA